MQPISPGPGSTAQASLHTPHLGFGQKLYRSISTPRIIVAGLFASTVAFMLLLAGDGMEILTSIRAFVTAEGEYARVANEAGRQFRQYTRIRDEQAYERFVIALQRPLTFESIRQELSKEHPNLEGVREQLEKNGIWSEDTAGMVDLYRRFRDVSYMRRAMSLWQTGDQALQVLSKTATALRDEYNSPKPDQEHIARLMRDAEVSERQLPQLEHAFAENFGAAARFARDLFKWTLSISAALLLTLAILITWRLLSEAIEAKEKYRQLINTANDAILVANRENGRIIQANLKAEKITGVPADELIGRRIQDLLSSETEDAVESVVRGTAQAEGSNPTELIVRHVDGHAIPVEASVNLTTLDGRVVVQSLLRDISERKRFEAQLRQAAKMDAVGRLAGGVAHDFNNLLTVISGYGDLVQSQIAPEDPLHGSVEQIMKAAERATSLTQQLLAFSRHHMMKPKILDLNETVAEVEEMLRRLIGENITLKVVPHAGLGYVKADPRQIEQVIVNLAVNARDAMAAGGQLTISTTNAELTEKTIAGHPFIQPGSYVLLSVRDTGAGMDEKTAACIFEPFFTTKESGKGTGLGLAMVYGTVKQSGGYVLVQSAPDKGTTFDIYLPRVYSRKSEHVEEVAPSAQRGDETILVVEDQNEVRGLLQTVLQKNGYTVIEAANGRHALSKFHENSEDISLVITDMVMPEMGGVDLGTQLREHSESLKILYISGYTDTLLPRQSIPVGAAFLQKPFTPDVLTRKVREVLDDPREPANTPEFHGRHQA